ncbi:MAG: 3-dehydroquinate synthase [Pirellulales bacterium]
MTSQTVRVELAGDAAADRSYTIAVGQGVLAEVGPALKAAGCTRAVVIADAAVAGSHGSRVRSRLESAGIESLTFTVASGEGSKAASEAVRLWEAFAEAAIDRKTQIVAVGGGVIGDLAGFVAATYVRGLGVWHVPTTLVAQVDSAIGGKTGINLPTGKNLVGSFWQPRGVFSDIDTLATLPAREFRSGLAEVVKYGMIRDAAFFDWLEVHQSAIAAADAEALHEIILISSRHKAEVVSQDEHETSGLRAILNYGHTFAHAFESASGYGQFLHGEAVSLGMAAAARLALILGRIDAALVERQDALLAALGLPIDFVAVSRGLKTDDLLAIMRRDKKAVSGKLRFVLPTRLGHVELVDGIDATMVAGVLAGQGSP